MKTNKILVVLVVVLVVLNLGTLSFLWYTKSTTTTKEVRQNNRPHIERFLKKRLKLNKEQLKLFREARESHFDESRSLMKKMQDLRKSLVLLSEDNDQERVDSLLNELSIVQKSFEKSNYEHMSKLRSYCNENQQITFDSVMITMFEHLSNPDKRRMRKRRGR